MREYHVVSWLEWQETYGLQIQRRMMEILTKQGLADTFTLDQLIAAEVTARQEILGREVQS